MGIRRKEGGKKPRSFHNFEHLERAIRRGRESRVCYIIDSRGNVYFGSPKQTHEDLKEALIRRGLNEENIEGGGSLAILRKSIVHYPASMAMLGTPPLTPEKAVSMEENIERELKSRGIGGVKFEDRKIMNKEWRERFYRIKEEARRRREYGLWGD